MEGPSFAACARSESSFRRISPIIGSAPSTIAPAARHEPVASSTPPSDLRNGGGAMVREGA